ncbi:MAG: rod shape-determining protein MreD [Legionellaceae bacterium]|nr:rod shape-determining protein MreD [Legionellaceae bacterium]
MLLRWYLIFAVALLLSICLFPAPLMGMEPVWLVLVLLYAFWYEPKIVPWWLLAVWGLLMDVLFSSPFGEHVLALMLIYGLARLPSRPFSRLLVPQQMALVGACVSSYLIVLALMLRLQGYPIIWTEIVMKTLMSTLFWPWISLVFRKKRVLQ